MPTSNESNKNKSERGSNSRKALRALLDNAKDNNYIKMIKPRYSLGLEGYKNEKQFNCAFLIQFLDDTEWLIFSTTSVRDRIKGNFWDALFLKKLNPKITRAYLVYPDSIKPDELQNALRNHRNIINKVNYSPLEGVIPQSDLFELIEKYAINDNTKGQRSNIVGNSFETRIVAILNNQLNLKRWKSEANNDNSDHTIDGLHYDIFKLIVDAFKLDNSTVTHITATNKINLLPSGGKPKTDVLVTVTQDGKPDTFYTISCKRSGKKSVSVHQKSAKDFSKVLDPDNEELKQLLFLFQKCGNRRDMGTENAQKLTNAIKPYISKLTLWALSGKGDEGDPTQIAEYLVSYNTASNSISIHEINEYCKEIMANCHGAFGTPFGWTYQGTRGSSIQLKCKLP